MLDFILRLKNPNYQTVFVFNNWTDKLSLKENTVYTVLLCSVFWDLNFLYEQLVYSVIGIINKVCIYFLINIVNNTFQSVWIAPLSKKKKKLQILCEFWSVSNINRHVFKKLTHKWKSSHYRIISSADGKSGEVFRVHKSFLESSGFWSVRGLDDDWILIFGWTFSLNVF